MGSYHLIDLPKRGMKNHMEHRQGSVWSKLTGSDVFIVAEIGKNFIQSPDDRPQAEYLENARELIFAAAEAGADAVKFQTHHFEDEQYNMPVTSPHFTGAERYQWVKRNSEATPRQFWQQLKRFCDEVGIIFFSTPMSRGAAQLLATIGVPLWKVGSGDTLDFVMLDYLRRTKLPIIISSGMSSLAELDQSIAFIQAYNQRVALMHCVSQYPCAPEDLHLHTITFFQQRYSIPIGFSDHSLGIDASLCAVKLGARIIEKHFSLSRELWGSDHKVSLTPPEFKTMVTRIRQRRLDIAEPERYLGKPVTTQLPDNESRFRPLFRKTLVAATKIPAGTTLTAPLLYAMRPQGSLPGLPSEAYETVLGKKVTVDLQPLELIRPEFLSPARSYRAAIAAQQK